MNIHKYDLMLNRSIAGKTIALGFFILLLMFLSVGATAADFYMLNDNLMEDKNPGFEDSGTFTGLERVSTSPRSGSYCGKQEYTAWNLDDFTGDFSGYFAYLSDTPLSGSNIVVGRKYRFSVWNKNTFSTGDICIGIEFKNSSGTLIERKFQKITNNATSWQFCKMEFIPPVGTTQINPFFFIEATVVADPATDALPDVYWDDLVIDPLNLVADPGFERASIPYVNAVHDSSNQRSGAYCAKQTYTYGYVGNTMYYNGSDPIVECGAGERFRLTIWNKNDASSSSSANLDDRIAIGIRFINSSGGSISYVWKEIPHNSTNWQKCTLEFTTPTGTAKINPYTKIGKNVSAGYDIYWDDISIEALNRAVDPGFEDAFSHYGGMSLDASNQRTGTYCAKQIYTGGGTWNCIYSGYPYVKCSPNESLSLTVWNKNNVPTSASTNLDDRISIGVRFVDSTGGSISYAWKEIPHNSASWQSCTLEFTAPAGAVAVNPYFRIGKNIASGYDVYWDDISIEPSAVYASAYGTAHSSATINAAITAIGTDQRTLVLDGARWTVDGGGGNVSIPSNIILKIEDGTTVGIGPTYTLTINGQVNLSPTTKFDGTGDVIINNSAIEAMPQWWGAIADDSTDCAPGMRSAIASGAMNIYLSPGTYLIKSRSGVVANSQEYVFDLPSDVNIYGDGMKASIIKMDDDVLMDSTAPLGSGVFLLDNEDDASFKNFTIDMNGNNNLVPTGTLKASYAIRAIASENIVVEGVHFKDNPGRNNIVFAGGTNHIVRSCYLLNGGTSLEDNTEQDDFSSIYIDSTYTVCEKNIIRNELYPFDGSGGIEMHAAYTSCTQNYIARSYPAVYIYVDGHETSTDMTFQDNYAIECIQGVCIGSGISEGTPGSVLDDVTIKDNYFSLKQFTSSTHLETVYSYAVYISNGAPGHFMNLKMTNSLISGNVMDDLDTSPSTPRSYFFIGGALQNVTISDNIINKTSGDAIVLYGNPYDLDDVTISDNVINSFGMNSNISNTNKRFAISFNLPGYESDYPVAGYFDSDNVQIIDNTIDRSSSSDYAWAFYFNWDNSSVITDLLVEGNTIETNVSPNVKYGLKSGDVDILP